MDELSNAYRCLGITEGSSLSEVRKAYRRLAKKYHPDSNPSDSSKSNLMMMKINEAYTLIKQHMSQGNTKRTAAENRRAGSGAPFVYEDPLYEDTDVLWERRYGKKSQESRGESLEELLRREQEAYRQFWERMVDEREKESEDRKTYIIILKYTYAFITFFYKYKLNSIVSRSRPYSMEVYEEFLDKFQLLIEKSAKLLRESKSRLYSERLLLLHEFLKSFMDDTKAIYPANMERRASAVHLFEEALDTRDRFISFFFEHPGMGRKEARDRLMHSLNLFEDFLQAFPDSPLIESCLDKIDVLEKLYHAFLRDEG
jgi:curved DNA-binding protein CbpA